MVVFPVSSQDGSPLSALPSYYRDGKHLVNFQLDKAEDGTIRIHREKCADFVHHYTDIVIPPTGQAIEISHLEETMIRERRYKFKALDYRTHDRADSIRILAEKIFDRDGMDETSAKQLSGIIDIEMDMCKTKSGGRAVEKSSGWAAGLAEMSRDAHAKGRKR